MSSSSAPLLSVVIPTHKRPYSLTRAINSALQSAPDGDVEVIVVPNGVDESWKSVAGQFKQAKVQWHCIPTSHANAARNHGLLMARGKYIRFLDDDDYLLHPAASDQLMEAERCGVDAISGGIVSVHGDSKNQPVSDQPITSDIAAAMLCSSRTTNPHAHLFLRTSLASLRWDESLSIRQDTDFLIRYSIKPSVRWQRFSQPVGVWVHHGNTRISRGKDPGKLGLRHTAQLILDAVDTLKARNELNRERRRAAADGLWSAAQKGLLYEWNFWMHAISVAQELDPESTPPSVLYRIGQRVGVPPLWIAVALLPPRFVLSTFRATSRAPVQAQHLK